MGACASSSILQRRQLFVVFFHRDFRIAIRVEYQPSPDRLGRTAAQTDGFGADTELPEMSQAVRMVYVGSGFHPGHMVEAGAFKRNRMKRRATLQLPDLVPQSSIRNSSRRQTPEKEERQWFTSRACAQKTRIARHGGDLEGPATYSNTTLREAETKRETLAFVMPNRQKRNPVRSALSTDSAHTLECYVEADFLSYLPEPSGAGLKNYLTTPELFS